MADCPDCGASLPEEGGACPTCLAAAAETRIEPAQDPLGSTLDLSGSAEEAAPPRRAFGDYELIEEIARGGMGVVYKARQISLERVVALKMILAGELAGEAAVQRFRFEAEAAAGLDHPGIVPVYEVGELEGRHYFSMGFVEGRSLAQRLEQDGPLKPREVATLVRDVAEAVAYAHGRGVIHRDLKPANVLLDGSGQPRVTDFGLARRIEDPGELTATGQVLGTPGYMAPEQVRGRRGEVGVGSDVYALGGILYAALAGRPPFQGADLMVVLRQVVEQEPPAVSSRQGDVPRDLATICHKCLEKDPQARYASARELAEDLGRFLRSEPIAARPLSWAGRLVRWGRRKPLEATLVGVIGVSLIAIYASLASAARTAKEGQAVAEQEQARADEARGRAEAERVRAEAARDRADGMRLTAESSLALARNPGLALVLATEGARRAPGPLANHALYAALEACSEERTLLGHEGPVRSATFDPSGQRIATAGADGTARVWDAQTGEALAILRHTEGVEDVAFARFSPDGARLLTMTASHGARVWDAASGALVVSVGVRDPSRQSYRLMPDHEYCSAAFSPDGRRLVTATGIYPDNEAEVWDAETGKRLFRLKGHSAQVVWAAFSPDGQRIATASFDGTARVWDATNGAAEWVLRGEPGAVRAAAFSPDGRWLLTRGEGTVYTLSQTAGRISSFMESAPVPNAAVVWDLRTGSRAMSLAWPGERAPAGAALFSPDGKTIVTGPYRLGHVPARVWSAATGESVRVLEGTARPGKGAFAWDPRGGRIALPGIQAVGVWDVRSGEQRLALRGHEGPVHGLAFSPDGQRLVTAGEDGSARVWRVEPPRRSFDGNAAAFDADRLVLSRYRPGRGVQGGFDVWSLPERRRVSSGTWSNGFGTGGVALGPAGVLTSGWRCALFDAETGRQKIEYGTATAAVLSPDGAHAFLAGFAPPGARQNGRLVAGLGVLVEVESGRVVFSVGGAPAVQVRDALFSPNGRWILTRRSGYGQNSLVPDDRSLARIWDATHGAARVVLRDPPRSKVDRAQITALAWSPDSTRTMLGDAAGRVKVFGAADGALQQTLTGGRKAIQTVAVDPQGRWVLAAGGRRAWLWGLSRGALQHELVHGAAVSEACFSPDGALVLTASEDGTAKLWDAATGRERATLAHTDRSPLRGGRFSPDGRWVLTIAKDGQARLWAVDPLAEALERLPRSLTPAERKRLELRPR